MVIGNGMLARAFGVYQASDDVVVFASGTANSSEDDESAFTRELDLLADTRSEHPEALLIYFSTCSIADRDRIGTPYVQHKINTENLIQNSSLPYLIFRLPVVVGYSNLAKTLPFYFRDCIENGCVLPVWRNAVRYPIDVEDVAQMCGLAIDNPSLHRSCIDIALRAYDVPRIVRGMESVLGKKAITRIVDRGCRYTIDLSAARELADVLGIAYDDEYLSRMLEKYFSPRNRFDEQVAVSDRAHC